MLAENSFSYSKKQTKVIRSRDFKNYVQRNFNLDLDIALPNIDWDIAGRTSKQHLIMLPLFMHLLKAVE
jgi:hypothetical protein